MRTLLIALVALSVAPSMAIAGGGSKQGGTVKVTNNGTDTLAVIVDPSSSISNSLASGTLSASQFLGAGGRFVGPGGVATIGGLKAGTHNVVAAYVSGTSSGSTVGTVSDLSVTVNKGKTTNVSGTGNVQTGVTLQ
jgi:hypothetical protein